MTTVKDKLKLLGGVLSIASVLAFATPAEAYWHHHRHYYRHHHWHHHHRAYVKIHL